MRMQRVAIVLWVGLALASATAAQQGQSAPQPAQQGAAPGSSPGAGEPATPATPEQLIEQGEAILRRGGLTGQKVRTLLETARKDADIIRITCLDDKLTQINANLRGAEARVEALRNAVDADRRMHEYTVLTVLGQKLEVLDQEAHQCVGEAMYETGDTTVVTEIDRDMLPFEETPSVPPPVLPPSLPTLPQPASPTR